MKVLRRLVTAIVILNALLIGVAVFARRLIPTHGDEESNTFALLASMSGLEFRSRAPAITSGRATAIAGGIDLDLREAGIADGATLELTAVAGGIDVAVPDGWRVEMRSRAVAGDVANETDPDAAGTSAPLLVVVAAAYFGGIRVGVREGAALG